VESISVDDPRVADPAVRRRWISVE
jgi:hypothetical protein